MCEFERAGTQHLAGLVCGGGDQRQAGGDAGGLSGGGGDLAQARAGRDQVGQDVLIHRHGLPFPVKAVGPALGFIVEGDVGHLAAGGIDVFAGQQVGEVTGEQQVLVGGFPDLRLLGADPVGLGLGLQVGHRLGHARGGKGRAPKSGNGLEAVRAALVKPHDGRAQGLAVLIQVDQGGALGGERHRGDAAFIHPVLREQPLAGLADRLPEHLGLLLAHTLRAGRVGDGDALFGQQGAARVKQQRAHRLGTVIDRQQVFGHGVPPHQG